MQRLWRLCRRNPLASSLLLFAILTLTLGSVVSTYFAFRAEAARKQADNEATSANQARNKADNEATNAKQARDKADAERKAAEKAREQAAAINTFLTEILLASARPEELGKDITVHAALDEAIKEIDSYFGDQPEVEAGVRLAIGETYRQLGLYDKAEKQVGRSVELRKQLFGTDSLETLKASYRLALLLWNQGKWREAELLLSNIVQKREQVLGSEDIATIQAKNSLAVVVTDLGNYKEGEMLVHEIQKLDLRVLPQNHPQRVMALKGMAKVYLGKGHLGKAQIVYEQALGQIQTVFGNKDPRYPESLDKLAETFQAQGKYEQALSRYQEALKLRQEVLGEHHPEYAAALVNLAALYRELGEYGKALSLYQESLSTTQKILGERHPQYAQCLDNLAKLYQDQGEYGKALALYQHALALRKAVLGENHPDYSSSLTNLAELYTIQAEYSKALPMYQQALVNRKERLGKKHPQYAQCLTSLGKLYKAQGEYSKALTLYYHVSALYKEVLGEQHPQYAQCLDNLASIRRSLGEYGKALILYQQANAHFREVLGAKHPEFARSLNNLAMLYQDQGEYSKAESLYKQALALTKEVLGERHPLYATGLNNLANVYRSQGEYSKAEPLYNQTLALRLEVLGEKHPLYAQSLHSLATLYRFKGAYSKAEPLYKQALVIKKEILGEKHPLYAQNLHSVATLYRLQGEYSKAEPLFKQALAVCKEGLGDKHPQYADTLNGLALLCYSQEKYLLAEKWFSQAAESFLQSRTLVSQEGLLRASHTNEHSHLTILVSVLARNGKVKEAWHWLEQTLGRAIFDEVAARSIYTVENQRQLDQLRGSIDQTETRLKQLTSHPKLTEEKQQLQKRWLREHTQNYARLGELYKQLEEKYGITEGKSYSLEQIQKVLPSDTAFLTWIDAEKEHWVVLVRDKGEPIFRQIKAAKTIWTEEDALSEKLNKLLQAPRGNTEERARLLLKLREQRIVPIAEEINDIQHVVVLPSALMDGFPVELLLPTKKVSYSPSATIYSYLQQQEPVRGNRLLALGDPIFDPQEELKEKALPESGLLITSVVVNSVADISGLQPYQVLLAYNGKELNSINDLQNAMTSAEAKKEVRIKVWREGKTFEQLIPLGNLGVVLSKKPAKVALQNRREKNNWQLIPRGENWNALPGTRIEAVNIAKLVGQDIRELLLDSEASEQQLYKMASSDKLKEFKYLHFATHGHVNRFLPMESAIILSRDNLTANIAELKANEPYFDGRLTAKEVALHWQLDADLVTLSACNSGLGKHAKGEGFMGFAQSFLIRGSRSVVLSLWSVDDTATALLMIRFYENLIKKSMTKLDALREAKKWLRTLPQSEVLKLSAKMTNGVARGKGVKKSLLVAPNRPQQRSTDCPYADPYYWASFILIGNPK